MQSILERVVQQHGDSVYLFFRHLFTLNRPILLKSDIRDAFVEYCATEAGTQLSRSEFTSFIQTVLEAVLQPPWIFFSLRAEIAQAQYLSVNADDLLLSTVSPSEFLSFKERLVTPPGAIDTWTLEIDLDPFERGFPKLKETRSIGRGAYSI